jgi:diguanylate cyclase (GGDEF)-like protein
MALLTVSTSAWAARRDVPQLSAADIEKTHSLVGDWRFRPGDDPAWAAPGYDDSGWVDHRVPQRWPDGGFEGSNQFGWYRLTLKFDVSTGESRNYLSHIGVKLGKVMSAYELYAGGKLVGGVGKLPPLSEVNYDRKRVFFIPPSAFGADGTLVLALRVWGGSELSVSRWGAGPHEGDFRIGGFAELQEQTFLEELPGLMACCLFLGFGFYHLYLQRRNRQLATYLWYGLMAVDMGIYGLMSNQWRYQLGWSFVAYEKIELGAIYVFPALALQLMWSLLGLPVRPWQRAYQFSFVGIAVIVLVVPGLNFHFYSLTPWQLWTAALVVILPWLIIREARAGNREARTSVLGMLVFVFAAAHDILIDLAGWESTRLIVPAFGVILLSMAVSLANRFTTVFTDLEGEVAQRTADLRTANQKLVEVARLDPLTGVLNRRGFTEKVEDEIQRSLRTGREFSIALADLDNFKKFNDQNGHACGDYVLQKTAQLLAQSVRELDEIARWGGEEFVLILRETSADGASSAAETLRITVANHRFEYEGKSLAVTMTLGVATYRKGETLDACIARADAALYRGKEGGRNQVNSRA